MPIDSAKKRKAAVPGTLPTPDGAIDAADRAQVAGVYSQFSDSVPDTGTDLIRITAVAISVDVKTVRDRGDGTSSASTAVTISFNKVFADIISIDVFPIQNAGEKLYRVIDFLDAPDPTSFDVRFYDNTGTQVARDFGWTAEGILKYS